MLGLKRIMNVLHGFKVIEIFSQKLSRRKASERDQFFGLLGHLQDDLDRLGRPDIYRPPLPAVPIGSDGRKTTLRLSTSDTLILALII